MKNTRRKFSPAFKTKVVLEAIKERYTLSELAQQFDLHPNQIGIWKKEFLDNVEKVFDNPGKDRTQVNQEKERQELYRQIGQLKVENDWLKKKVL
jgi:transposase